MKKKNPGKKEEKNAQETKDEKVNGDVMSSSPAPVSCLVRFAGPRSGPNSHPDFLVRSILGLMLEHCDVEVFCREGKFHVHRIVLASMSPFLSALLRPEDGCVHRLPDEILLPEVGARTFQVLLVSRTVANSLPLRMRALDLGKLIHSYVLYF